MLTIKIFHELAPREQKYRKAAEPECETNIQKNNYDYQALCQ